VDNSYTQERRELVEKTVDNSCDVGWVQDTGNWKNKKCSKNGTLDGCHHPTLNKKSPNSIPLDKINNYAIL